MSGRFLRPLPRRVGVRLHQARVLVSMPSPRSSFSICFDLVGCFLSVGCLKGDFGGDGAAPVNRSWPFSPHAPAAAAEADVHREVLS